MSKKGNFLAIGVTALAIGGAAAALVAFLNMKKNCGWLPPYTFFPDADYGWTGEENAVLIAPFVSEAEIRRTCEKINKDGKYCYVAVRYGNNVYYRPSLFLPAKKYWNGKGPSPKTDGSYVRPSIRFRPEGFDMR